MPEYDLPSVVSTTVTRYGGATSRLGAMIAVNKSARDNRVAMPVRSGPSRLGPAWQGMQARSRKIVAPRFASPLVQSTDWSSLFHAASFSPFPLFNVAANFGWVFSNQ